MLSNLDDSYTRFLEPKEFNQMRIDTSGELTGVGIQIVMRLTMLLEICFQI